MCNVIRVIYSLVICEESFTLYVIHFKFNIYSPFYNSLLPSLLHEYEAFVGALQQQVDFYKVRFRDQYIAFCFIVPLSITVHSIIPFVHIQDIPALNLGLKINLSQIAWSYSLSHSLLACARTWPLSFTAFAVHYLPVIVSFEAT